MTVTSGGNHELNRHTVHMEQRRHMQITGVTDVHSFHENEIVLRVDSASMVLTGENLHVGRLLLEEGKVDVNGQIDSIIYEKPRAVRKLLWRNQKK